MSYCPILSYQRDTTATKYCMGIDCELADEVGECLIKQALQCYVSAERTRVAKENERIRKETELMKTYWALKKDGTKSPIVFLKEGETTPYTTPADFKPDPDFPKPDASYVDAGGITWVHQPTTEKYPHGEWYEDLSNLRKEPE